MSGYFAMRRYSISARRWAWAKNLSSAFVWGISCFQSWVALRSINLKYGHRVAITNRCAWWERINVVSLPVRNHGYAVDNNTLGTDWEPLFILWNDGSNEGIRHKTKPFGSRHSSIRSCIGTTDTEFLFDEFWSCYKPCIKRTSMKDEIKKVLLLGSGALKIGEAGEFDYSGSQALKALKEEGIETVLINPNIATVQTSEGVVDQIYFRPLLLIFREGDRKGNVRRCAPVFERTDCLELWGGTVQKQVSSKIQCPCVGYSRAGHHGYWRPWIVCRKNWMKSMSRPSRAKRWKTERCPSRR